MIILGSVGGYTYLDGLTVDAHLARATKAKVRYEPLKAIAEYREALKLEDNAHTHKLLAETLDDSGFLMEAITEFRAAQMGGEPDDAIHFRLASLLERIDHKGEALLEYKEFVGSETCLQIDVRCEGARQRIKEAEAKTETR
jgi:hypothetical protein